MDEECRKPQFGEAIQKAMARRWCDLTLEESQHFARTLLDEPADAVRDRHASRVDADEGDGVELVVPLDDLVSDTGESTADIFLRHNVFDCHKKTSCA